MNKRRVSSCSIPEFYVKKLRRDHPDPNAIPLYRQRGLLSRYIPDFIVVTDRDENVIVEIKGQVNDEADIKAKAAERWVEAVNRLGDKGVWHYILVEDPGRVGLQVNRLTNAQWQDSPFQLTE